VAGAAELAALHEALPGCVRCPALAAARTTVVVGSGPPDAELMLVGEAPGFNEDRSGIPFVGQAGQLLDRLLGEVGLARSGVFVANVLKCRPPGNRDPLPDEIANCRGYLERQVELVSPRAICSLGNFATKLLSGSPTGITRVHGTPQPIAVGGWRGFLYPIFHPAAALRTPAMMAVLRDDLARLPALLADGPAIAPSPASAVPRPALADSEQLGLF
jgi:DNA polymerase